jgi:predicted signal transduction protein with EAL and GGDEF domain
VSDLSDTFVQALPDLTIVVRRDGVILANLGGHEFGVATRPGALSERRLEDVWSPKVATEIAQLCRRALKLRGPVEGTIRQPDFTADLRVRPQGIDRALIVMRAPHAATGKHSPVRAADCTEFARAFCGAITNAQLRETHVALAVVHLRDLRALSKAHGSSVAERVAAGVLERAMFTDSQPGSPPRAVRAAQLENDQLAVLLEGLSGRQAALHAAERLRHSLARPYDIDGLRHRIVPVIGLATFPFDGRDPESLLDSARAAILETQRNGNTQPIATASEASGLWSLSRMDLQGELRWALERDQFSLRYLPRVELQGRRTVALDTRLQWLHPVCGAVPPDQFMPLLTSLDLRSALDRWVVRHGATELKRHNERGSVRLNLSVALAARTLEGEDLIEEITSHFASADLGLGRLDVNVDLKALASSGKVRVALHELRARGATVFLEEFGTDGVAIARLAKLPLDGVRVAREFTESMDQNPGARAGCAAAIGTARAFGLKSIAEGIVRRSQLDVLFECGCDQATGPLFGKPLLGTELCVDFTPESVEFGAAPTTASAK